MKKILIFLVLIIASCTKNTGYPRGHSEFDFLQEDIVDMEAEFESIYRENMQLKYEADSLQRDLREIVENTENNQDKLDEKSADELPGPKDRVMEDQIRVSRNKVVIDIDNIYWGYMLDSNSMDPLLDEGTTVLTVKPSGPNDISIGDLLVYKANLSEYNIVHRVINISADDEGIFFITKGDNNPYDDPFRIRFNDVVAIVIGIIY